MQFDHILFETDGPLVTITLNRPEAMNALHSPAHFELHAAFDRFAADPSLWVAVLTGTGNRAFCAGNDLKFQAGGGTLALPPSGFAGLCNRFDLAKPVIAAVNGFAMGGGLEIALACDLIVAADHAQFALPEPKVGLAAMAGGLHRLPRQIGLKPAMGMLLTGRRVDAAEALGLGLVNEVVSRDRLSSAVRAWADQILACSPMSIRATKGAALSGLALADLDQAISRQFDHPAMQQMIASADFIEGPRAFAEKRAPIWQGR